MVCWLHSSGQFEGFPNDRPLVVVALPEARPFGVRVDSRPGTKLQDGPFEAGLHVVHGLRIALYSAVFPTLP